MGGHAAVLGRLQLAGQVGAQQLGPAEEVALERVQRHVHRRGGSRIVEPGHEAENDRCAVIERQALDRRRDLGAQFGRLGGGGGVAVEASVGQAGGASWTRVTLDRAERGAQAGSRA